MAIRKDTSQSFQTRLQSAVWYSRNTELKNQIQRSVEMLGKENVQKLDLAS